jgi:hypothetical protein
MEPEFSKQADWLAFTLHFIFGLVVGFFGGFYLITRNASRINLAEAFIIPFLFGASLIGAGLATKLGDRLWIGDNYRIIPPDAPRHSRVSHYSSILALVLGSVMVGLSIISHFLK